MVSGVSYRAAATHAGVTHRAIGEAVRSGRIKLQPDGTVMLADVDQWSAGRRAARGGAHRVDRRVSAARQPATKVAGIRQPAARAQTVAGSVLDPAGDLKSAQALAIVLECGAHDLAHVACRHVSLGVAQAIVEQWKAESLADWVGGPTVTQTPYCDEADSGWPDPPGVDHWWQHPLFCPLHDSTDWPEAEAAGAAWRAERGLPAP